MDTPKSSTKGLLIAFTYGVISISITFFNKAVFHYGFAYPNVLTLAQMCTALGFLFFFKRVGVISFPDFDMKYCKAAFLLSMLFFLQVVTGLGSLRLLTVPMFSALRRFTTLIVMVGEYVMLNKEAPQSDVMAVSIMVLGALLAAVRDFSFSLLGYIMVTVNCAITAVYLVEIKRVAQATKLNTFGLLFYNNLLSCPLLFVFLVLKGELVDSFDFPYWSNFGFGSSFIASAVFAFLLNLAIFLCTSYNSALTTSITGQIKAIVTTAGGLFLFGDVIFDFWNLLGLFVSMVGSLLYAKLQYERQHAPKVPFKSVKSERQDV